MRAPNNVCRYMHFFDTFIFSRFSIINQVIHPVICNGEKTHKNKCSTRVFFFFGAEKNNGGLWGKQAPQAA